MAVKLLLFLLYTIKAIAWVTFPGYTYRFSTSICLITSLSSEVRCGHPCQKNVDDVTAAVYDIYSVRLLYLPFISHKQESKVLPPFEGVSLLLDGRVFL